MQSHRRPSRKKNESCRPFTCAQFMSRKGDLFFFRGWVTSFKMRPRHISLPINAEMIRANISNGDHRAKCHLRKPFKDGPLQQCGVHQQPSEPYSTDCLHHTVNLKFTREWPFDSVRIKAPTHNSNIFHNLFCTYTSEESIRSKKAPCLLAVTKDVKNTCQWSDRSNKHINYCIWSLKFNLTWSFI